MQVKNYSFGMTTHERFSKKASLAKKVVEEEVTVANPGDIENEATAELLQKIDAKKLKGAQKRTCCQNCKLMMYTKELPT